MSTSEQLEQAIQALEAQRFVLGDAVVDSSIAALREKLAALAPRPSVRERKQASILFADVSGFTAISEIMDAEDVSNLMNALWECLDAAILRYEGRIDKHIGDAVMALWGTPIAQEDDPERAVRAGLAMQAALRDFRTEKNVDLAMRVGINTGPVLFGEIGTTAEFTAMGDAVNLASRLEHAAPAGEVLISHNTYQHVRGLFEFQKLAPIMVKGKKDPIQIYLALKARSRAFRVLSRGVRGVETRMVGRDAELGRLQDLFYTAVEDRETNVVTISGEAGIGKSRLLYEFNNWLDLETIENLKILQGRAVRATVGSPYSLIRDLISFFFDIHENETASNAREILVRSIAKVLDGDPNGVEKAHFIGQTLGYDFEESPYLVNILSDTRQIHNRAYRYFVEFFNALALQGPVVMYLEDIHWADDGSLDLIGYLLRESGFLPLLILCLARETLFERRPHWGKGRSAHTRIALHHLTKRESRLLVDEILQNISRVPQALRELIIANAEGNPYYMEELVKVMVDDGVIEVHDDQWEINPNRLVAVNVPGTLTGIIQARLDHLPAVERAALQGASVVGRVFWSGALAAIGAVKPSSAEAVLDSLRKKELIFAREHPAFEGEREYIFKHAILHEVTYENVLKSQRKVFHAGAAAWLIDNCADRTDHFAGQIGEHYALAEKLALAGVWFGKAGEQAMGAYAVQTAIEYLNRALELLSHSREHKVKCLQFYESLGTLYIWQNQIKEAEIAAQKFISLADSLQDSSAAARAWILLGQIQEQKGELQNALASASVAVGTLEAAEDINLLARALLVYGNYAYMLGQIDVCEDSAARVIDLTPHVVLRAQALTLLGFINIDLGKEADAFAYMDEVCELYQRSGNKRGEMDTQINLGALAHESGDFSKALKYYAAANDIAIEINDPNTQIYMLSDIGALQVEMGDPAAAEANLREALRLSEETGEQASYAYAQLYLAQALLAQEKVSLAFSIAQKALVLMQGMDRQEFLGDAWLVLARCLSAAAGVVEVVVGKQSYDVDKCFSASVEAFSEMGAIGKQVQAFKAWASDYRQRGNIEQAEIKEAEAAELLAHIDEIHDDHDPVDRHHEFDD